ncbi:MAG: flagellar basal body P-ring formation chaperone FlgA [Campylobacterales bacterium]
MKIIFAIFCWLLSLSASALTTPFDAAIKAEIEAVFTERFPTIEINAIKLDAITLRQPEGWCLENITLNRSALHHSRGYAEAIIAKDKAKRKLLFRYDINATIEVLKAVHNIRMGTILSSDLVVRERVALTNLRAIPADVHKIGKIRAKHYIRAGSIIDSSSIIPVPDLPKNSEITLIVKESGIELQITATTLEDGIIGQEIKVRTNEGKIHRAKLLTTKEALLL